MISSKLSMIYNGCCQQSIQPIQTAGIHTSPPPEREQGRQWALMGAICPSSPKAQQNLQTMLQKDFEMHNRDSEIETNLKFPFANPI